ncbi:MAG TPA: hypothetical protein VIM37_00410 [Candidatus Microsaccharimonas sp.]|jgi:hypothetical protein
MAKKTQIQTKAQLSEATLVQRNIAILCIFIIGSPIFISFIVNRYSLLFYVPPILAILVVIILLIKKTKATILVAMILAIICTIILFPFVMLPFTPWHF